MNLCSNGHEEVAFASLTMSDCPACMYADEVREEMQQEIDELKEKING